MEDNWKKKYNELSDAVHEYLLTKPRQVRSLGKFLDSHGWIEIEVPSEVRWKSPDNLQLYGIKQAAHMVREKARKKMAILSGNGKIYGKSCARGSVTGC
jgi:hypothetical protein